MGDSWRLVTATPAKKGKEGKRGGREGGEGGWGVRRGSTKQTSFGPLVTFKLKPFHLANNGEMRTQD